MTGELRGWKEISAYLGVTDRTAQRWESELHLPIHRMRQHGASPVYALTDEIDAWRRSSEGEQASAEQMAPPGSSGPEAGELGERLSADAGERLGAALPTTAAPGARRKRAWVVPVALAAVAVCAATVALLVYGLSRPIPSKPPAAAPRLPSAASAGYAYTYSDSPFVVVTFEIIDSDNAKFRARSPGGQMIRVTLPSGTQYGLSAVQSGTSVRTNVLLLANGGHSLKVLDSFIMARGVPHTFVRGSDSFQFTWITSDAIPAGAPWASVPLQGCGFQCTQGRPGYDRRPATFVEADEVSSPCGTCCDPDFGACSQRKKQRP
ncbi:MAG: hypothetical protein ACM3NQ_09240 [Bacteroidales bacterium]